ncbi:DUF3152 domain-containing protein [Cellulomonas xylanilytica]|uniref:DUF3152 domain-containing protein n=1 Tax=Cellulomonas xylanilytica TaxID=233583 RepID=A0A510V8M5_9CELL|nr:DUF3152 domain-containing protein [Cellulomonas xylanilytica]GEK22311.1 hypothetical protein CXY01_28310 [Cellulomonas xylanilytica]
MTTPEPLRTDGGLTRASLRRSAPRRRRRAAPGGRALPALVAVVGLAVGAGSALWAADAPQAAGVVGAALGTSSPAPADVVDRVGAQSRGSSGREPLVPEPVDAPVGMLPSEPAPGIVALPPGLTIQDVEAGLLSPEVVESGLGTFSVVPGVDPGPGTGAVRTVRVEVEDGLAVDGAAFAATVMATLNDPRGWGADGSLSFARTDGDAELRVMLASPTAVDDLCAPLDTVGEFSCGTKGRAVLNLRRWVLATQEYGVDKTGYRQYLVNHEVGHLLGHGHETCRGAGQPAPLMQQQSYRAAPCVPSSWPYP